MTSAGHYGERLREAGIAVDTLGLERGRITPAAISHLSRKIREYQPHVIQTWMYHADFLGGIVGRFSGTAAVSWGLRNSTLDARHSRTSTRLIARACALLSYWLPDAIVSCSEVATEVHRRLGYCKRKFRQIPNGIDTSKYQPDPVARLTLRTQWGVASDDFLIGMVARVDPQKDHSTFLRAAARLKSLGVGRFKFVLIGSGTESATSILRPAIQQLQIEDDVILAGPRDDICRVMPALDLHMLTSAYGEAFPNVLTEAMACGVPCVATDVGDSHKIIGDTGWIVPIRDVDRVVAAVNEAVRRADETRRGIIPMNCRSRVQNLFSLDAMVKSYDSLWRELATGRRHTARAAG
jgi:glycosyltransferase involved in cell wall biosynthesis